MLVPHGGGGHCALEVIGELNGKTAVELIAHVREAIEQRGYQEVEVDLSGVWAIDASGVWGLIEAKAVGRGAVRFSGHSLAVMARLSGKSIDSSVRAANDDFTNLA